MEDKNKKLQVFFLKIIFDYIKTSQQEKNPKLNSISLVYILV